MVKIELDQDVWNRLIEIWKRYERLTKESWGPVETDENGGEWIKIPHHDLFLGDLEDTDKCCYDIADFIIHSKDDIPYLLGLIKEILDGKGSSEAWFFPSSEEHK